MMIRQSRREHRDPETPNVSGGRGRWGWLAIPALGVIGFLLYANIAGDASVTARRENQRGKSGSVIKRACAIPRSWAKYTARGWEPGEAQDWDVAVIPKEQNWFGSFRATSHSGPFDYLQDVPLVFYGPGFIQDTGTISLDREVTLADVAPTQARVMGFSEFESDGTAIEEVLKPTPKTPAALVTVVIDGGGWNVLRTTEGTWPRLAELMEAGASIDRAVVGSSPSITPAVHTTLSTGVWPYEHGVTAIVTRSEEGELLGGFTQVQYDRDETNSDPTLNLESQTLADRWDLATNNRAEVAMVASQNFHLGMVGHGASIEGADKDIAAMTQGRRWATNTEYFSLPPYVNSFRELLERGLRATDVADGHSDGKWRGHGFLNIESTPAYSRWEAHLFKNILRREGFGEDEITDLAYINFKAPDAAGHEWNMIAPEQRDAMRSVDQELGELVKFLNDEIGRDRYVLAVTADHGQTPLGGRGWAIDQIEARADLEDRFDQLDNGPGREIVKTTSAGTYFFNRGEMQANDVTPDQVAAFLNNYTVKDNIPEDSDVPDEYKGRLNDEIFVAAIPGASIDDMARCAGVRLD